MQMLTLDKKPDCEEGLVVGESFEMSGVVGALSVALDITEGQPPGHAARTCLIGMRLAEELCLSDDDKSALYYALLLKDLGCSSNAAKMCWLFGADDRLIKHDLKTINWTKAWDAFRFSWQRVAQGGATVQKVLQMVRMAREGEAGARALVETRCERGAEIIRQLELPEAAAKAVRSLDEHWNGKGHPDGLQGQDIPLLARIACLAQTVEVFFASYGLQEAMQVARERRGKWFDPALVDALESTAGDAVFWAALVADVSREQLARWEPASHKIQADSAAIDRIAQAFASVVDAKSPWTHKHSTGVAEIARGISRELGDSPRLQHDIWRAGLLHDVGKLGVSNLILDKPGRPTEEEFAEIRKHPEFTYRILHEISGFGYFARIAGAHHERLDGKGYFQGIDGAELTHEGRILAVADVFEALSAKRPYRDEMPREKVHEIMSKDLGRGLCPETYEALLRWLDKTRITPRVEAQLSEIERIHSQV